MAVMAILIHHLMETIVEITPHDRILEIKLFFFSLHKFENISKNIFSYWFTVYYYLKPISSEVKKKASTSSRVTKQ